MAVLDTLINFGSLGAVGKVLGSGERCRRLVVLFSTWLKMQKSSRINFNLLVVESTSTSLHIKKIMNSKL